MDVDTFKTRYGLKSFRYNCCPNLEKAVLPLENILSIIFKKNGTNMGLQNMSC